MRLMRLFAPIALVAVLAIALTGCGGSAKTNKKASTDSSATAVAAVIKDKRIIGTWKSTSTTSTVEFQANGEAILQDGTRVDFAMPSPEVLQFKFQSGTQTYDIQWKSDNEHGSRLVGGKDNKFEYYTRQK